MGEDDYRERIERRLQPFLQRMELEAQDRERKLVEADPKKHSTTTIMAGKSNYLRWPAKRIVDDEQERVSEVHFCYSTGRNIAGYFLAWREVVELKGGVGKRDRWVAFKKRRVARDWAERARDIHNEKIS
jgi:hypothetical protein